jgi:hypothetical protein
MRLCLFKCESAFDGALAAFEVAADDFVGHVSCSGFDWSKIHRRCNESSGNVCNIISFSRGMKCGAVGRSCAHWNVTSVSRVGG